MAWAILILVTGAVTTTTIVGAELYSITATAPQFSTK
jgi:hypothetical protein